MSKSLFTSKTFWFNLAALAVAIGSGQAWVPIDPKVAGTLVAVGNIALRRITEAPVHLFPPK